ncbi:CDP-glycerol glycerophosphotransferase family protein [Staphylococcus durrellii]|uniref:CDP-glycerol glycerophosphotransferase family protein n=1 Tax=Staphylococcus durrellii TaxID=2781773 RepID=UPI00189E8F29|nr:CDP-glycerol glycerophosphotransferase family protein [Staphylococcus durrellii]MBF7016134.1 CDP-glycerol glycerophosphotransferase family protein [Staphylococcus durrellii]
MPIQNNLKKVKNILKLPVAYYSYKTANENTDDAIKYDSLKNLYPLLKKQAGYYAELSNLAFNQHKWNDALHYINKAIDHVTREQRYLFYKQKALILEQQNKPQQYIDFLADYLKYYHQDSQALLKMVRTQLKLHNTKTAVSYLAQYLKQHPNDYEYHLEIAQYYLKLKEYNHTIEHANYYLSRYTANAKALLLIIDAYKKHKQYNKAVPYIKKYLASHPTDVAKSYQLARYYDKQGKHQEAVDYYKHTINNSVDQYSARELSNLNYELGLIQLKLKDNVSADNSFNEAVYLSGDNKAHTWGIGVIHEKNEHWQLAVDAFIKQLDYLPDDASLIYKIGTLYRKLKQPHNAIHYFEQALQRDKVLSPWHYNLAVSYEDIGDFKNAEKWFESAIQRQQTHRPGNYRKLARIYNKLGKFEQALDAYNEAELFSMPSNMGKATYEKNIKKLSIRYGISYEHYNIDDKMVFYESLSGARVMCNPAGVFDYVLDHKDFEDFTHVWVVNNFDNIPKLLRQRDNIIFVKRNSDAYFKYISIAKYLICNSTFSDFITRKPDQKYLQTTHGVFYKTVGRDSAGTQLGVAGSTRNLLQATHILSPNDFMVGKQKSAYSIEGIYSGQMAKAGYPRIDVTLNASEELQEYMKNHINNLDKTKKIVLYAPTWRGENKKGNSFDTEKLVNDLSQLAKLDANILFRGHTITQGLLKNVKLPENIILPPNDIATNELLNITDVIISDYSSVFFDFIPTERPIVHYIYDIDEYVANRGLNLSTDELPGFIAKSTEELVNAVQKGLTDPTPSPQYLTAKDKFCPLDKGHSGEAVAKWFFYGDTSQVEIIKENNYKQRDLYLGGNFSDTDVLPTFVKDVNNRIADGHSVSIMLKKQISEDAEKFNYMNQLDDSTNFLAHAGPMPMTLKEMIAIADLKKENVYHDVTMKQARKAAYERETRRLFGDSTFEYVENLEQTSPYWQGIYEMLSDKN